MKGREEMRLLRDEGIDWVYLWVMEKSMRKKRPRKKKKRDYKRAFELLQLITALAQLLAVILSPRAKLI